MHAHTFAAMGTVVSVRTHAPLDAAVATALADAFEDLEAVFSLWQPETEASAIAAGRLRADDASAAYRRVRQQARLWKVRTNGAFDPVRPDGTEDLSGIVKALGIQAAADVLAGAGVRDWCLNAGGDVLTSGIGEEDAPWVVGIVDPGDRAALLSAFVTGGTQPAVATSGYAERGDHVWRPTPTVEFVQVTVCAADIVTADVLATAILAGGPGTLEAMQRLYPIGVLAVTASGGAWASEAFRAAA